MASKQTSNFGLNQWAPEDQVLREDFNRDNTIIDGALRVLAEDLSGVAAANPYAKLAQITLTQDAPRVDMDLSGVDMGQYKALHLYAAVYMGAVNSNTSILCNGITTGYGTPGGSNTGHRLAACLSGVDYPSLHVLNLLLGRDIIACFNDGGRWDGNNFGRLSSSCGSLRLDNARLHTLNFIGEGMAGYSNILAGSEFTLYGLKK